MNSTVAKLTRSKYRDARSPLSIRRATRADVPLVLSFVNDLAEYEKLSHLVVATEEVIASFEEATPQQVEAALAAK